MPRHNDGDLCRYCIPHKMKGRVQCQHCRGFRNPNRRLARKQAKKQNDLNSPKKGY